MPGRISSYPESACDVGWLDMFKHTYVIDHVKNNVKKQLSDGSSPLNEIKWLNEEVC